MSSWGLLATIVGIVVGLATIVGLGPAIWRFMCLPGRIEQRLEKLDQLDNIEEAARTAATLAAQAHEEWKGATHVVTSEMGRMSSQVDDHERRINRLERDR